MERVYPMEPGECVGEGRWVEAIYYESVGGLEGIRHILMKCDVEFIPMEQSPTFFCRQANGGIKMYLPMVKYRRLYVIWEKKPTEPYFGENYPQWDIIVDDGSAE